MKSVLRLYSYPENCCCNRKHCRVFSISLFSSGFRACVHQMGFFFYACSFMISFSERVQSKKKKGLLAFAQSFIPQSPLFNLEGLEKKSCPGAGSRCRHGNWFSLWKVVDNVDIVLQVLGSDWSVREKGRWRPRQRSKSWEERKKRKRNGTVTAQLPWELLL